MSKPQLSIIILSYNTSSLLRDCINSLLKVNKEVSFEVIVSDNGSSDGSIEMVKSEFPWVRLIENGQNLGFAKGNNRARKLVQGKYVLFLNSDTVVHKDAIKKTVELLEARADLGAVTCKLVLSDGSLDPDTRRRFPTPWVSFNRLVLASGKLYWYGDISEDIPHEVDVIQGAFHLSPKKVLDSVNWFSEEYFLDGEDIDLCWKIKAKGYGILYYPKVSVTHLKGASKGKSEAKKKVPFKSRLKFRMASVNSMEIFYKKFLWKKYPLIVNIIVISAIKVLKVVRFVKTLI